jgi:hypothetical protein
MKTFEKTFEISLSEHEQNEIGKELAEKRILMAQLQTKISDIKSDYKKRIDGLDAEVLAKSKMIKSGKAPKKINCYCNLDDPNTGKKSYYSVDNNELIETQDMTPEELGDPNQMNAFDTEDEPLNYFLNIYGVDFHSIDYEDKVAFIANNPSDLEEHDIAIGEIDEVKKCLLVKSTENAMKDIFEKVEAIYEIPTDFTNVNWYAFPQLKEIDNNYEVVEKEEGTKGNN